MPILWMSSFSGVKPFTYGKNTLISTVNNWSVPTKLGPDNILNRIFGSGTGAPGGDNGGGGPYITAVGKKATPASSYSASCGIGVAPSSFDPSSNCLTFSIFNGTNDYKFGISFWVRGFIPTDTTSYRVGMRVGVPATYTGSLFYPCQFGPFDMSHTNDNSASYAWYKIDLPPYKGLEFYLEYEWDHVSGKITIYIDDVMVASVANTGSYAGGGGFTLSNIFYSGSGQSVMMELRDMYIQRIDSPADKRLGSNTSVRQVRLLGDDAVDFERPAGFETNADVAGLPLRNPAYSTSNPKDDGLLGATATGQRDLYSLDKGSVSSTLSAVEAVQVRTMASNRGTGVRNFGAIASSGSVTVDAAATSAAPSDTESTFNTLVMTADPADGQRWDMTRLGNLKVGSKLYP